MSSLTLTIDLEDPTESYKADGRYVAMTEHILNLCDIHNRKATFFTIGKIAQTNPALIRLIAQRGHEIAYHTHTHVSLTEEMPKRFAQETREDKDRLEGLTGKPLLGFRAPCYSLTPQTQWATEILKDLGFLYSSSVMPSRISRFGFPDKPSAPFVWPSGLIEFPMPMIGIGSMRLPFCGGIYLYALPTLITDMCFALADHQSVLWTYAHPYDFDRDEPYVPMPNTPAWISRTLWLSRRLSEKKIRKLLSRHSIGNTLGEIALKMPQAKTIS